MKIILLIILFPFISVFSIKAQILKYEIVSSDKDNRGKINQLSVYVHSISDVKKVNPIIWNKYKNTGISSFQIFYFDNKKIATTYAKKVFDNKITDAQVDKLSKHVIGKFEYVLGKESFYIGEDALIN
jgi:hypothetical protein